MKYIYLFILLLVGFISQGQSLISSAGKSEQLEGLNISYTIGEMIIQTYTSNKFDVTQGFHQPHLKISAVSQFNPPVDIKIYPNPSHDFAILEIPQADDNYRYDLYDTDGKIIISSEIIDTKTQIDLSPLATAIYFLKVSNSNNSKKVYKIIKSK